MDLAITENLEITNIDNSRLNQMKKTENTIENGAIQILEGLDMFCEDMLDKYDDSIPYDKLFCALRQIISTALEKEAVRDAIMTGIITEKKGGIKSQPVEKKEAAKKEEPKVRKQKNLSAITLYAKTHTLKEICEHFEFKSTSSAKDYVVYHKIDYVRVNRSDMFKDYEEQVRKLAPSMRLCELAKVFGKTRHAMGMYCMRKDINYLGRGERNERG